MNHRGVEILNCVNEKEQFHMHLNIHIKFALFKRIDLFDMNILGRKPTLLQKKTYCYFAHKKYLN